MIKPESDEGECDAIVVWRSDDVKTVQAAVVAADFLYDARQWRQICTARWEVMNNTKWRNIWSGINQPIPVINQSMK